MSNTARFMLVLTTVCLVAGGGVGSIYLLTRTPIAVKAEAEERAVRMRVLPQAKDFRDLEKGSGVHAGLDTENGETVGYVAVGEARGYGGALTVMVGLDKNLVTVKAAVLQHAETPGLGAECATVKSKDLIWTVILGGPRSKGTSWMDQFAGKRKGQLVLGAAIDARTGCSITSKAIVQAARTAIQKVEKRLKAE